MSHEELKADLALLIKTSDALNEKAWDAECDQLHVECMRQRNALDRLIQAVTLAVHGESCFPAENCCFLGR